MLELKSGKNKKKIWIVSELFYPSETSTGYILTKIALWLSKEFDIYVITRIDEKLCRKNYEEYKGIKIFRYSPPFFDRGILIFRIVEAIRFSVAILIRTIMKISRDDLVLCVTNPPFLPNIINLSAFIKQAKLIVLVHDVYPDLLVAVRLIKNSSYIYRIWSYLNYLLYKTARLIIVLSSDMKDLLIKRFNSKGLDKKIKVISNWAELDLINMLSKSSSRIREKYNLNNKFVVQYAGNFGRPNDIETIVSSANQLKTERDVVFLFAGDGPKRKFVENQKRILNLDNIILINRYRRHEQQDILAAADLAIIALVRGMKGISFPSRLYNILASGRPIIGIVEENSDLAKLIRRENIGWVVEPGDYKSLAETIEKAKKDLTLEEKGIKARKLAEKYYSYENIMELFEKCLKQIDDK